MNLTDDWRAGKLKDIYYHVQDEYGNIYPARYVTCQQKFAQFLPRKIVDVLAVCDYEKLQASFQEKEEAKEIIAELEDKNTQLEKKLEIAVKALEHIKRLPVRVCCDNTAEQALKEIKESYLEELRSGCGSGRSR